MVVDEHEGFGKVSRLWSSFFCDGWEAGRDLHKAIRRQRQMCIGDKHTDFSRGRSGGLVFPSLSEFPTGSWVPVSHTHRTLPTNSLVEISGIRVNRKNRQNYD